jgi:hypothetical protein
LWPSPLGDPGSSGSVDLLGTGFSFVNGSLTITDDTMTVAALRVSGSCSVGDFILQSDGHGGTLINYQT